MFELDKRLASDTVPIGDLALCRLLLMNDSQYPWIILVPKVQDTTEISQLNDEQRSILAGESNDVAQLLMQEFAGDKMNIAALGNVVSQLHIHHIVRYQSDKAWPAPVWGAYPATPYSEEELTQLKQRLGKLFSNVKNFESYQ
ncbi:HIT domain-containing protein [Kangiella sp. TOML190]|uniref:HIT domain-containing protein n=1 Tax=Kangiella sp. TOML190 TaxID=2931351 RepID=UPI00203DBF48|nr:HIT domain-containing protein [Kangiella sp. TOML190]